ncbi:hypothetical protein DPMN_042256 [Dreissena polymorpha]|uniref:Uncharacterized protein n=1 Tax=Dreissena polymorpha TaxID=45954 RepID=A0A9D4CYC5_DREPO|nr:hypothetical protein DPMN_042256 [Dreissena polymorpha]
MHTFNDQCTSDYDSDLSSQLQDFRQRIQSTACALEIGLRGMGIYKGNLVASPVDNNTDSDCQSWSVRICQIYSFLGAATVDLNTENNSFQEVDHKGSVIIG